MKYENQGGKGQTQQATRPFLSQLLGVYNEAVCRATNYI